MTSNLKHPPIATAVGIVALAAGLAWPAAAQQPPASPRPVVPAPVTPGDPRPTPTIPEKVEPKAKPDTITGSGATLSDQLEKTNGVIKPPQVAAPGMVVPAPPVGDREMVVPAPPPGRSATVPPPAGAPGARQNTTPR